MSDQVLDDSGPEEPQTAALERTVNVPAVVMDSFESTIARLEEREDARWLVSVYTAPFCRQTGSSERCGLLELQEADAAR